MVFIIDAADRIIHLDDEWAKYAAEKGEADLATDRLIGRPIWSFLHGIETIHLYRLLVLRARRGVQIESRLRVEAGGVSQFMRMRMQSVGGDSVIFEATPLPEDIAPEDMAASMESSGGRPQDPNVSQEEVAPALLVVCSWCGRLKIRDETWVEVEVAISQLGLFELESLPQMSHGVCEECYQAMGGGEGPQSDQVLQQFVDVAAHSS